MRSVAPSLVLLLLAATGCVHPELVNEYEPESAQPSRVEPVVVSQVVVDDDDESDDDAPQTGSPPPAPPAPPALPASPHDRRQPEPVPFRLGAGRGALGHIDLAPCREQGLLAGYVHMRVTFRHSGRVVTAAVEAPAAPPPEALSCIGEQLEVAMVPAFDGADVTLSKSFFVN